MDKETFLEKVEKIHPRYLNSPTFHKDGYVSLPTREDPFGELDLTYEEALKDLKERAIFYMEKYI